MRPEGEVRDEASVAVGDFRDDGDLVDLGERDGDPHGRRGRPPASGTEDGRRRVLPPVDELVEAAHDAGDIVLLREGELRVALRVDVDEPGQGLGDAPSHEVPFLPHQHVFPGDPLRDLDLGFLSLGLEGSALQQVDLEAPLGVEIGRELDVDGVLIDRLEVLQHPRHDRREVGPGQQLIEGQDPDIAPGAPGGPHPLGGFLVPDADEVQTGVDPLVDELHQGQGVKPVVLEVEQVHVVLRKAPGVPDPPV